MKKALTTYSTNNYLFVAVVAAAVVAAAAAVAAVAVAAAAVAAAAAAVAVVAAVAAAAVAAAAVASAAVDAADAIAQMNKEKELSCCVRKDLTTYSTTSPTMTPVTPRPKSVPEVLITSCRLYRRKLLLYINNIYCPPACCRLYMFECREVIYNCYTVILCAEPKFLVLLREEKSAMNFARSQESVPSVFIQNPAENVDSF